MNKITHLIPAHPIFFSMTDFWLTLCPAYKSEIYILKSINDKKSYDCKHENVVVLEYYSNIDLANKIFQIVKESDISIFHSLFFSPLVKWILLLKGFSRYFDKITWIEWGFDLYFEDYSSVKTTVFSILKKGTVHLFEKKIPNFVSIYPTDLKYYDYVIRGVAFKQFAPYIEEKGIPEYLRTFKKIKISEKQKNGIPITIQIGHRADHILNHKDTLRKLSRFVRENIKLYIPLCYGDKEYADEIKKYAYKIFGDKAKCQMELCSYEEYIRNISDVDIFILNSDRQIALGNLHPMMIMEKKIVIPKKSVLYDYFSSFAPLFCYEDLEKCDINSFFKDVDMSIAREKIIEYKNIDPKESWEKVLKNIVER